MDVGATIRALRERQGLNMTQLARRVGVTRSYIGQLESGVRSPNLDMLERLARGLDVDPPDLLREHTLYDMRRKPTVTADRLRTVGFHLNDTEARVLEQRLLIHEDPPHGPVAVGYVRRKDEPVDEQKISSAVAYAVRYLYTNDQAEAWRTNVLEAYAS